MSDSGSYLGSERPSPSKGGSSFRRAVLEFTVIAVGVFTALAAEAAWGERLERAEEREALGQLLGEFHANAARLDSAGAVHQLSLDASYELLALTKALGEANGDEPPEVLIHRMGMVYTFDPIRGGLTSLISAGKLGIIRSDSLRIALAAWPDLVNDLGENEREEWHHIFDQLQPYLIEKGARTDVVLASGGLRRIAPDAAAPDVSSVLADAVFAEMVASRIVHLHDVLDEVETVRASIEEIVRLINASRQSAS